MDWSLGSDRAFSVESLVRLSGLVPVVNGALGAKAPAEILRNDSGHMILRFTVPALAGSTYSGDHTRSKRSLLAVVLDRRMARPDRVDSFGLRFERIENLRAYLRNGYYSWDGSSFVEPEGLQQWEEYERRPETGYAMTQLLPRNGGGSVVLGFERHDRFQQAFSFGTHSSPPSLTVLTLWDRKRLTGPHTGQGSRWTVNRSSATTVDKVAVTLAPHDGSLIFVSPTSILSAPEHLP